MAVDLLARPAVAASAVHRQRWVWLTSLTSIAALVGAAALAPVIGDSPSRLLMLVLFVGSSVHVAATGWLFTFADVRRHAAEHRVRYGAMPVALVAIGVVVATLLSTRHLDVVLLGYFGWQFIHYQKQNVGVAALSASALGIRSLSRAERRLILATGWIGVGGLILHPGLLQLVGLGWQLSTPFRLATIAFAAAGVIAAAVMSLRPSTERPAGFCVAYLVAIYFPLPIFLFASPYAAVAGMTIAHGLQYLVLVGMVAAGPKRSMPRLPIVASYLLVAVVGGTALSLASHLHRGGTIAHAGYGAYLGVVMTHFVVDAGLWRLRDPGRRAFLAQRLPGLIRQS